jgi:hypothetical protein
MSPSNDPFAPLKPSRTPPIPSRDDSGPKRCVKPMAVAADGYSEASSWLRLHLVGRGYMTDVVSSALGRGRPIRARMAGRQRCRDQQLGSYLCHSENLTSGNKTKWIAAWQVVVWLKSHKWWLLPLCHAPPACRYQPSPQKVLSVSETKRLIYLQQP